MKHIIFIILSILFLSCNVSSKKDGQYTTNETEVQNNNCKNADSLPVKKFIDQTDIFCDSTKFPDFKENLVLISVKPNNTKFHDKRAKEFIFNECKNDSLFCGEISKKLSRSYSYNDEWTLDLIGYSLDQDSGMEENSASFFVLAVNRNGQIWFNDILSDLMGEIK